jgi:hypothetical protein
MECRISLGVILLWYLSARTRAEKRNVDLQADLQVSWRGRRFVSRRDRNTRQGAAGDHRAGLLLIFLSLCELPE